MRKLAEAKVPFWVPTEGELRHNRRAASAASAIAAEYAWTTVSIDAEGRLDEARASTLRIRSTSSCEGVGVGSGFIVSGGRLITNRHVVSGTNGVNIESWDGDPVSADVSGQGTWADLALLNVSAGDGLAVPVSTLRDVLADSRTRRSVTPCSGFFQSP
jgi:S1-C subfamily serine protease